ncbi:MULTISPECIES: DUF5947 family protein [unclassified Nonomuraea]|uniref:DUF5947 family protein n=1 Tax=unclassified Nonomuraea TaxID=2593643 RepID=UPI0033C9A187
MTGSALRRLIARPGAAPGQRAVRSGGEAGEWCELCAAPLPEAHRHLLDLTARELRCACRPCSVLFSDNTGNTGNTGKTGGRGAAGGPYRLVPDRRWLLDGFELDDETWAGLSIPVQMAFLFHDAAARRTALFYPSPAGAVESPLEPSLWRRLEEANPVLRRVTPDVEALLVNRTGGAREHWIVPVDDCYTLVGLLRTHWKGLAGGSRVWDAISDFFGELRTRSTTVEGRTR